MKVRRNNRQFNVKSQVAVKRKSKLCHDKSKAATVKKEKAKNHAGTKPQPQSLSSQVESHKHTHRGLNEAAPVQPEGFSQRPYNSNLRYIHTKNMV